jgi:predicted ATPase/DNA-binding CsgD family transcriptional regulator
VAATLLERDHVLAELATLARTTTAGDGQMVLLRGEAGVGRSALLRRFVHMMADEAEVLLGYCDPLSAPRPLGPLIDMFNRLPGGRAAELAAAIDSGHNELIYKRLLELLRDGHRWLFVIDDAQWADGATLDLLRFLARRLEALPVLIVVSYRDFELGQGHPLAVMLGDMSSHGSITRIKLSPLSIEAVGLMAAGTGFDPAYLHRLSGGNPFYINELLMSDGADSSSTLPRSIAESAWGRLARLSSEAREAAEVAAVCGPDVDPRLVDILCPGAATGLKECVRAGLMTATDDVVRFRHELVRLATLEQIPDYVRRELDRNVLARRLDSQADTRPSMPRHSGRHVLAAAHIAETHDHRRYSAAHPQRLTRREYEILELLAVGHSDAEIATRLFISQRTVNNHVHAILHKLGAQNRTQAAAYLHTKPSDTEPDAADG